MFAPGAAIKGGKQVMGRFVTDGSTRGNWLIRSREGAVGDKIPGNPYMVEAVKLRGLLYTIPELQREFPGIFENPSLPVVLEVGCYMGHTVMELAEHNPGINVLGLDIKYKRVVKSVRKIERAGLSNAKIALGDVMELLAVLPGHSLYGIFIFFPDPWVKGRHEKHRYLREHFFNLASLRLAPGGAVWLKTDQKKYFDEILAAARQHNFSQISRLPDKIAHREYRTIFEDTFSRQDIPSYQVILSPGPVTAADSDVKGV